MGYIVAFLIFIFVISVLGFLFTVLWPVLLALFVVGAISTYMAYRKRKKYFEQFYQDANTMFYEQDDAVNQGVSSDDIIDVEFSEEEVEEK